MSESVSLAKKAQTVLENAVDGAIGKVPIRGNNRNGLVTDENDDEERDSNSDLTWKNMEIARVILDKQCY